MLNCYFNCQSMPDYECDTQDIFFFKSMLLLYVSLEKCLVTFRI